MWNLRAGPAHLVLALLALGLLGGPAAAQFAPGGGGHHRRNGNAASPAADPVVAPKLAPQPLQRLDAGAVLCGTEDNLAQHQAAVAARLAGQQASEPPGCHIVQAQTPVTVIDRHGPARTEVRLDARTGWTDSIVRTP